MCIRDSITTVRMLVLGVMVGVTSSPCIIIVVAEVTYNILVFRNSSCIVLDVVVVDV